MLFLLFLFSEEKFALSCSGRKLSHAGFNWKEDGETCSGMTDVVWDGICLHLENGIGKTFFPYHSFFLPTRAGGFFSAKAGKAGGRRLFFFFFFPPKMVASQILTGLVVLVVEMDFAHFVSPGSLPPGESIPLGRTCQ